MPWFWQLNVYILFVQFFADVFFIVFSTGYHRCRLEERHNLGHSGKNGTGNMLYVAYKVHYCQWAGPDKQIHKIWLLFLLSWCKILNQFKIIMVAVGVRFRFRVRIRIRNLQSNSGILHRHWVRLYRKQRPKTLKMKIPKKSPALLSGILSIHILYCFTASGTNWGPSFLGS